MNNVRNIVGLLESSPRTAHGGPDLVLYLVQKGDLDLKEDYLTLLFCPGDKKDLHSVREAVTCRLAVAGGLKLGDVDQAVNGGADILVFGSFLSMNSDPGQLAEKIVNRIRTVCA